MKRLFLTVALVFFLFRPAAVRADLFGGDVAVLSQILVNAVQQLVQLKSILETTQGNLELMQQVYKGIHQALDLIKTVNPTWDPGLYGDWKSVEEGIHKLQSEYGVVVPSLDAPIQKDADQSAAEAIALNNSIYEYTKEIDDIGEQIKSHSQSTSPAGAQKLTAQSMGVMLHVLNQGLRAQATGLKLQAQTLAIENRRDKEMTKHVLESSDSLRTEMKRKKSFFNYPRF